MKRMKLTSITLAIMMIVIAFAISPSTLAASPQEPDIVVTTVAELQSALSPANAGARILVRAGVYDVSQALTVPDRAALIGEGVMTFDESGLPTGFEPSGRTLLRATAALAGDVLTLGDGATVRGLAIENIAGPGHAVAVVSRAPGDFVSARIEECEIINPNLPANGRGLAIMRACVDDVTLRSRPGRETVVSLHKRIELRNDAPLARPELVQLRNAG